MTTKTYTLRNLKSFIAANFGRIYTKTLTDFDGMTDCVDRVDDEFELDTAGDSDMESYTLGYKKIWLVSRNTIVDYRDDKFVGFKVYNSCGSFIVATPLKFKGMPTPKSGVFVVYDFLPSQRYVVIKSDRSYWTVDRSTGEFEKYSTDRQKLSNCNDFSKRHTGIEVKFEDWTQYYDTNIEI